MNSWNEGYITDSNYTSGYYTELSPNYIRFNLLMQGIELPASSEINYLELGFGLGLSINIHAACSSGHYVGTDFNPSQVLEAKKLASSTNAHLDLYDDSFEKLAKRDDLPKFDIITLHGIWSWVSDENRQNIVRIIEKNLKVGGVVYIGYNTYPGWSAFAPVRELMKLHSDSAGQATANIHTTIPKAIEFIDTIKDSTYYLKANENARSHLERMKTMNMDYLGHEYFNADWKAYYFYQMCNDLAEAKLNFVTSASALDNINYINYPQELLENLHSYSPIMRESIKDFVKNQSFRRDLFTKGHKDLNNFESLEILKNQRLVLLTTIDKIEYKVSTVFGDISLKQELYQPVIENLAQDNYKPKTVREIFKAENCITNNLANIAEILKILLGSGVIAPCQDEKEIHKNRNKAQNLNKYLCQSAISSSLHPYLASVVTNSAHVCNRIEMLIIGAINQGVKDKDLAQKMIDDFASNDERLQENGQTLEPEQALEFAKRLVNEFNTKRLPIFKALQIIQP